MTLEQIFKLLEAGYTKSEIQAMESAPAPDPEPAEPEQAPEPAAPKPADPAVSPDIQALSQQVQDMVAAIKTMNIHFNQQPAQEEQPETAQDILANIINPKPTRGK